MSEFKKDITAALKIYTGLSLTTKEDKTFLVEGRLDLFNDETNLVFETFDVEITFPQSYPNRFPNVVETSGKIERIPDRHLFINDHFRLCLGVPVEERILCRKGINFSWFIEKVLLPRLYDEYRVNNGLSYTREYSHSNGIWEFYFKSFESENPELVIILLQTITLPQVQQRQQICPCGSKKLFKKCHLNITNQFNVLPTDYIKEQIQFLKDNPFKPRQKL